MLTSLEISGFKSIRNAHVEFGRINLFIGGNGTGKSAILEAIATVSSCIGSGPGEKIFLDKGVRLTPPELIKSSFKDEPSPETISLVAEFSSGASYEVAFGNGEKDGQIRIFSETLRKASEVLFERNPMAATLLGKPFSISKRPSHGMWEYVDPSDKLPKDVFEELDQFSRFAIHSPQTEILRGVVKNPTDLVPIGVHGEKLPAAVIGFLDSIDSRKSRLKDDKLSKADSSTVRMELEILQKAGDLVQLPKWAETFGIRQPGEVPTSSQVAEWNAPIVIFQDAFMHPERNRLSAYDSSEGTLYLLFAAIVLSHPEAPRLFALDNVDNALNPRITKALIRTIKDFTEIVAEANAGIGAKQVFLTSHNPTALDAIDIFDSDQRIFVVDRNANGHTTIERLEADSRLSREEWTDLMQGKELSQAWIDGDIPGALGAEL